MTYCVFDLETNGQQTFKRFCNPLDPRHSIELSCILSSGPAKMTSIWGDSREYIVSILLADSPSIIVGQNIKFDMLWIWDVPRFQEWIKDGGIVWDTQTVEYLLQGQTKESRNLDTLSMRYGGTLKDDRIKEYYKQGAQSKDIPKDLLLEYCEHDAKNTDIVFKGQKREARKLGMLPLIKTYMEHYLAVIEMEWNGLYINSDVAWKECDRLQAVLDGLYETLVSTVPDDCWDERVPFNPASSKQVSALLFGSQVSATVDMEKKDEDGNFIRYKTGIKAGQIKTKKEKIQIKPKGMEFKPQGRVGVTGAYTVDSKALKQIYEKDSPYKSFLHNLLQYREVAKLLSTYYYREEQMTRNKTKISGMLSLLMPHTGCVHTEFKTAETRTGRLASRNPNVQNLAPDCLDMFTSRFKDGKIIEFDFSQLEVCVQAVLSQSPRFIEDVLNGIDFHCLRLSYAEDKPYEEVIKLCSTDPVWKKKRKKAKVISFQKAYGAQPERIAKDAGLDVEVVKKVFKEEDRRYPEIPEYYESILDQIKQTTVKGEKLLPIKMKLEDGAVIKYMTREDESQYTGYAYTMFNKKYAFLDRAVLTKRGTVFRYYLMTEIQDYPIQGTAADIVALFVSQAYKKLHCLREHAKMINEVHDSLIIDCSSDYVQQVIDLMQDLSSQMTNLLKVRFGIEWSIPLKLDYSVSDSWAGCKE